MWLLFAFSGPFAWAASTHIDKYLVDTYFSDASTAVLMVFTAALDLIALPVIWLFVPSVFSLPTTAIVVMTLSGMLYMGAMLFYLRAIQSEEASVVAPLFQASVLWTALLAYLLLHETLTGVQMLGGALILCGALTLSLRSFRLPKLRGTLVLAMLGCTFALALSSVLFKLFAVEESFWPTTFWSFVGGGLFGLGLLALPGRLTQFLHLFRRHPGAMLGVNAANELINAGGGLGVRYASLLAPVSLVQAISSTTTLLVFFFGIILTLVAPQLGREDLSAKNLLQKGAAAILVAAGLILINSSFF